MGAEHHGACVGKDGWLCPLEWMTPSPPNVPPNPLPPSPSPYPPTYVAVHTELKQTKLAVFTLSVVVVGGALALVLAFAALGYMLCCRRRSTAPHLTSVVDEDAVEVSMHEYAPSHTGNGFGEMRTADDKY